MMPHGVMIAVRRVLSLRRRVPGSRETGDIDQLIPFLGLGLLLWLEEGIASDEGAGAVLGSLLLGIRFCWATQLLAGEIK